MVIRDTGSENALTELIYSMCLQPKRMSMSEIWTVEHGEGDQRFTFGVYSNMEAATLDIKAFYSAPYVVDWLDLKSTWQGFRLTGQFEAVQGWSSKHSTDFLLRRWYLDESWQDRKARYARE